MNTETGALAGQLAAATERAEQLQEDLDGLDALLEDERTDHAQTKAELKAAERRIQELESALQSIEREAHDARRTR